MWHKTKVGDVKYSWWDCSTGFDCSCGASDFIVTDEDRPPVECDCGKKYRLVTYLEVWEDIDDVHNRPS